MVGTRAAEDGLTPRSAAKRRQIVESARRLFLQRGFERTSMEAIREAAEVSKPTLYSHYAGKDELFADILRGLVAEATSAMPAPDAVPVLTSQAELREHVTRLVASSVTSTTRADYLHLVRVIAAEAPRLLHLAAAARDAVGQRAIDAVVATLRAARLHRLVREASPVEDEAAARMFVGYTLTHVVLGGLLADATDQPVVPPDPRQNEAMIDLFLRAVSP